MIKRAHSVLEVKAVNDDERVIRGIATTPAPDRVGDIVEPLGVKFKNPLPLLHQHDSSRPVGTVKFDKPTAAGITFEARLPRIDEPGPLKDRVDTAWGEVKAGLVRGVSIGFRPLEYSVMEDGGWRFLETEVMELSLVTVPANAEATITTIKSIDAELLAASGRNEPADPSPGASGKKAAHRVVKLQPIEERNPAMNIAEQIKSFEATRQSKAARMAEIMEESAKKGETLDAQQSEEYDGLEADVAKLDEHIKRLRTLEKANVAAAKPIELKPLEAGGNAPAVPATVKATPKVAPGLRFAQVVKCLGVAKGLPSAALEVAKARYGDDAGVIGVLKAAVAAGTTSNATWAGALVGDETSVYADFVEFLRPQTILGRFGNGGIPALRRVPFRVALVGQTSGGQGYWVGEGKGKPLTKFDFSRTTLEPLKVANIAVITEELLRDSSPAADVLVRDQLAAALRERLDIDFIDPSKAASAGVSPASITNGVTPIASSGTDADAIRTDIKALMATFIAANNAPTSGVWIMSATTALALSLMLNPLGQPEFPGIGMNGGTFVGLPVIVSEYLPSDTAGSIVVLANASDIYEADEGGIAIDMSREASLEMSDAPTQHSDGTPAGASLVSMFQTNSVAFRAERTINWAKRRASAVAYLSGVNWGAGA